jgi:hypothetical protein
VTPERGGAAQRHGAENASLLEGHQMFRLELGSVRADDVRDL